MSEITRTGAAGMNRELGRVCPKFTSGEPFVSSRNLDGTSEEAASVV
jgi:hypothetical protein